MTNGRPLRLEGSLPARVAVPARTIDVWTILEEDPLRWSVAAAVVSPDELRWLEEVIAPEVRPCRIRARAALRWILSAYLQLHPAEIELTTTRHGQPHLAGGELAFSLSHTRGMVAVAVAKADVGIDVERPRTVRLRALDRYLTEAEARAIQRGPDVATRAVAVWTRKEAVAKATGRHLGSLATVGVIGRDPDAPAYVRLGDRVVSVAGFELEHPYVGAVATLGWSPGVRRFRCRWSADVGLSVQEQHLDE